MREHANVNNIFHDVNSTLYAITNIHQKAGILHLVVNVFHNVNLTLFMVTSIHRIWKPDTRKQDGRWQKLQKKGEKKFTLNTLYNVLNILH